MLADQLVASGRSAAVLRTLALGLAGGILLGSLLLGS
jgi:hypothetical protein